MTQFVHDYVPALKYGAKITGDEIIGSTFTGDAYYVKPYSGSDGNDGLTAGSAFKTLVYALSKATANHGDVIYLVAESNTSASTTDYQSITTGTLGLVWNKDGVHLIGINDGSMLGQRSRIAQLSSVKGMTDLMTVTANNCLFANLEIYQGVASSTATYERALVIGTASSTSAVGQRNRFVNCQISGIGDSSMDDAGSRSLMIHGNATENSFQHCYIGLDTVIRGTAAYEVELLGVAGTTAKPGRTVFEDCIFSTYTSATGFKIIQSTYLDRFLLLKNCVLTAAAGITSAASPTGAIATTTPNGRCLLLNTAVFGCDNVTTADDTGTLVSAPAGGLVDMGLGTSVDISA